ncbi:hypothetical protein HYH03_017628 [Edaphochlamys debaryana]|uniref:Uncharacterized protein n=1 Tax=Edaphochlamys debaryana TaxID=47281 RepID=A0A836BNQ4_9CHLO|nr:hypothetical protein HYH03_017628 [Edaphochlamys debaryana]|eukprot:KAG2483521.1 hypothetical protein HYH03_017628 [Edaphochlamys debaryana]
MAMLEARALQRLSAASASNSSASSRAPQHPGPFPASSSAHPSAAPSLPPKRSIELERLQELARCAATLSGANVYEGCADDTPRTSTVLPPGQAGGGDAGADGWWQMGAGGGGGHGVRHRPRAPVVPR